ncbi:MAG TPA: DNA/RNA nuclease SfsA [Planctomycetota bacterium]|nr:DNA/RNA nuclease SfsA [Planctomycetota bacterium]
MRFPRPLVPGVLVRRYARFLADVRLDDGSVVTAHCPNTGSLLGCRDPGLPVWLLESANLERRLRFTWTLVRVGRSLVNVDTGVPNRVVHEAVASGAVAELAGYRSIRREVPYGRSSRIDLLLEDHPRDHRPCWVEVKCTTLARGSLGLFPDSVTERGRKHLRDLQREVRRGARAVQLFFLSRRAVRRFRPADEIDPAYGRELRRAARRGVEVLAYRANVSLRGVALGESVPVDLS